MLTLAGNLIWHGGAPGIEDTIKGLKECIPSLRFGV
jgi:hypothetical protein